MTVRFRADGNLGVVAIYDVPSVVSSDNVPMTDPLDTVSRLHFHSQLVYPALIQTITGTITLPSLAANGVREASTIVAAHGRAGIPYVEGKVLLSGSYVPLAGSVVVAQDVGVGGSSFFRMLALGADATNILLHESSMAYASGGYGSLAVAFEVYLFDTLVA